MRLFKVLLVDDDPAIREGLPLLIRWEDQGFHVAGVAENGKRALELLDKSPCDVLITDVRMPVMDGIELARQAQALRPPPCVVIVSAFGEFSYAQAAMRNGASRYLLKPIDERILCETLAEIRQQLNGPSGQGAEETTLLGKGVGMQSLHKEQTLKPIIAYVRLHCNEKLSLREMATRFYMNPAYLGRIFKLYTGVPFNDYLTSCRMIMAADLLCNTTLSVAAIAEKAGYYDQNYFCRLFKQSTGKTPSEYRQCPPLVK